MKINKRRVKSGTVKLSPEELDLSNGKLRVTMMVDFPVVKAFKELAEETGGKYQTLMNFALRQYLNQSSSFESRLTRIEAVLSQRSMHRNKDRRRR